MNSRQRRKAAAQEHNDRIELKKELRELQLAIYTKHGAKVRVEGWQENDRLRQQVAKLREILGADTLPEQEQRKVALVSGGSSIGRSAARQAMIMLALAAGIGHVGGAD